MIVIVASVWLYYEFITVVLVNALCLTYCWRLCITRAYIFVTYIVQKNLLILFFNGTKEEKDVELNYYHASCKKPSDASCIKSTRKLND